ncbi:sugar kinase, partial [Deinococcus sp. RIT780]|uniref:sugar kinase n=1 Tax=Deinococcus sp. RIT780 TaxID=2870472 RepID=UPI001C88F0FA|nr:sugar kinase [Deinococcus sp. RIT780]
MTGAVTRLERSLDLIALGECMIELRADGPLGDAPQLTRACGGDTLNALVSAARLGSRCGFISRVGNDPFGHGLRRAWQAEGIDVTHAPLVDGENGVYFISLHAGGEREFTYRRAGSAATHLSPADVDAAYVASSRTLLLSGITQAISQTAQAATRHAAQLARQCGTRVAFDPNYRPRLWADRAGDGTGLDAARAALHELLPFVDLLLPSFPADAALLDTAPADAPEAARAFAALGVTVALKGGADGAWLCSPHADPQHVPAPPVPDVLDTTGAGDAWNGAFLH